MVWKKTLNRRDGGVTFFRRKFCPIVPKNIVGEPFVFQKFSGMEKIKIKRAVSRFSVENLLSQCRKTLWVNNFVF